MIRSPRWRALRGLVIDRTHQGVFGLVVALRSVVCSPHFRKRRELVVASA